MPRLQLLPAVDVAGGRTVQLAQRVVRSAQVLADPLEAALRWQSAGARWVHLVDLDAAFGRGHNRAQLSAIVGALDIDVELSGGIRDDETLTAALATGCRRVNVSSAALEDPAWCSRTIAKYGDRVAIGLDVRGSRLVARGSNWADGELYDVLARLDRDGCARYVVTDVAGDGMLQGPNLDLLADVCTRTDRPVVASGGVSTLADVRALRDLVTVGIEGAIIGTALYISAFTLEDALAIASD
jgi:phosphoribosyl isomerase A